MGIKQYCWLVLTQVTVYTLYTGERVPVQQCCSSLALTLAEMFLRLANAD